MNEPRGFDTRLSNLLKTGDRAPDEAFVRRVETALSLRLSIAESRGTSLRAAVSDLCSLVVGSAAIAALLALLEPAALHLPVPLAIPGGGVTVVLAFAGTMAMWIIGSDRSEAF